MKLLFLLLLLLCWLQGFVEQTQGRRSQSFLMDMLEEVVKDEDSGSFHHALERFYVSLVGQGVDIHREVGSLSKSYRLRKVATENLDTEMKLKPGPGSNVPKEVLGLWYMKGNPMSDEVFSFAGSSFDEAERIGHVPTFTDDVWSFDDSVRGRILYSLLESTQLIYTFSFNKDMTFGTIVPVFSFGTVPTELANFTMTKIDDHQWRRDSTLFSVHKHVYYLTRIVDHAGKHTIHWDDFVNATGKYALLARRVRKTNDKEGIEMN